MTDSVSDPFRDAVLGICTRARTVTDPLEGALLLLATARVLDKIGAAAGVMGSPSPTTTPPGPSSDSDASKGPPDGVCIRRVVAGLTAGGAPAINVACPEHGVGPGVPCPAQSAPPVDPKIGGEWIKQSADVAPVPVPTEPADPIVLNQIRADSLAPTVPTVEIVGHRDAANGDSESWEVRRLGTDETVWRDDGDVMVIWPHALQRPETPNQDETASAFRARGGTTPDGIDDVWTWNFSRFSTHSSGVTSHWNPPIEAPAPEALHDSGPGSHPQAGEVVVRR